MGTSSGGVLTQFPKLDIAACAGGFSPVSGSQFLATSAFVLTAGGGIAANFTNGYAIQGRLSVGASPIAGTLGSIGIACSPTPAPPPPTDTDGDGTPDSSDAFPNDPTETTDTDGDGVGDNADAFPNDPNETTDTDGDGVGDNFDAFPNDPLKICLDGFTYDSVNKICIANDLGQESQDAADTINNIDTTVVDANVVTAVNAALNTVTTLATATSNQITSGDITTDGALDVVNTLTSGLNLAGTATQGGGTIDQTAVSNTLSGISNVFTALKTSAGTLTSTQISSVQAQTTSSVTAVTNLVTTTTTPTTAKSLISSVASVINAATSVGASLSTDLVTSAKSLSQTALQNTLTALASSTGINIQGVDATNVAQVQTALTQNRKLLIAVVDTVSIPLTSTLALNTASTSSTLQTAGISLTKANALAANFAQFANANGVSVQTSSGTVTASTSLNNALGGGTTNTTDTATNVTSIAFGSSTFPVNVSKIALVPDSVPNGLSFLPNGNVLSVSDGIATTVTPAASDPVNFSSTLFGAGAGVNDVSFNSNGSVDISTDDFSFSGSFAFDALNTGGSTSSEVSFTLPAGNPADPSYTYTVNYPNGSSQNILPFVAEDNFFDSLSNFGFDVSANRSNGIISVEGASLKPDYFVTPLSPTDQTFLDANQDSSGVAYRVTDANGDGVTDYEVISASGVQIVYGVP